MLRHFSLVLTLFLLMFSSANALEQGNTIHPVIGEKTPKYLKASDLLALPKIERQTWIHGAVAATIQTLGAYNDDQAQCALDWYFGGGKGKEVIPLALEKYKDVAATSIIYASIANICIEH